MSRKLVKMWVFTLNNYTDNDLTLIKEWLTEERCSYAIVGKEIGEQGTQHLQGFIHLKKRQLFTTMKKFLPNAHWEAARGSDLDNQQYCSKEEVFVEVGTPTKTTTKGGPGKTLKRAVELSHLLENDDYDITDIDRPAMMLYGKRIRLLAQEIKNKRELRQLESSYSGVEWKNWQQKLIDDTSKEADSRTITVVVDREGNKGKTFLARYLSCKGALYCTTTKRADIAQAFSHHKIVIFDLPRDNQDAISWGTIECIKNGLIFSPKYESHSKVSKPPHVLVFMNQHPDESRLSADRWNIINISDSQEKTEEDTLNEQIWINMMKELNKRYN